MDNCPVCLEVGVEPCTECGRLYHAKCIGQLLQNGFENCQCCFIPFSPNLHIKAAEYVTVVDKNSPASLVQLAAALTSAKRAPEALCMLKAIQKKPVRSLALKAALYLELGRAHLNVGEAKDAASELFVGFIFSQIGGLSSLGLHLRALALLTRAYFEQGDYEIVHKIAGAAMCQVHRMQHREAVSIMRVVADTYKAQKETDNYLITLEALSTVYSEGSRDALAKAEVDAELGLVEHDLGIGNSGVRLRPAIKTLRKHKHALTLPARLALQAQVKPSRRVMKKTHAEDTH